MSDRVFTLKINGFSKAGYGIQIETHSVTQDNLQTAIDWLDKTFPTMGIKGVVLSQEQRAEHLDAPKEEKECPIHKVMMSRKTKGKGSWYSHQLDDGTWCRGEVNGG